MLKYLRGNRTVRPCALLLGGFDGFHAGHRTLLDEAKKSGLPVGLTSISGGKAGGDVFTFQERELIFAREGFSFVEELRFTEELKNTPPEEFLRGLFARIPAKAVYCGEDFRFGKGALGTPRLLEKCAPCPVYPLPLKEIGGEKVAISRIKNLLASGDTAALQKLLGYPYFVRGEVEHGRGVGHTLGFPTVNLTFPKEKFPLREGVYVGSAVTPAGEYPSIVNFGARPTFGVEERKIEAHLKGFEGDLYGKEAEIRPMRFLRPVIKFANRRELENQLKEDLKNI